MRSAMARVPQQRTRPGRQHEGAWTLRPATGWGGGGERGREVTKSSSPQMGRSNWNFTTGLLVCPSFGPGMGTERPEAHHDHPRHGQLWKHMGVQGQRGPRGASPSGSPLRWRWVVGEAARKRHAQACPPTGIERAPTQIRVLCLWSYSSDRHSLGWVRGGQKGGRAKGSWLEGQCSCAPKTVGGTASPANLPRLHGGHRRELMISNNNIMTLSAQGGRGREWVQQGPSLPTAPTTARHHQTAAARHGVRSGHPGNHSGPHGIHNHIHMQHIH
jgi:hypothetical protein